MSWISDLVSRRSRNIHLVLIIVLSFGLILRHEKVNGFISEVVSVSLYYPFRKVRLSLGNARKRASDLARLTEELTEVSRQLTRCKEEQRETARLGDTLGFEPLPEFTLLPARVVQVTGLGRYLPVSATVNRGARDSVVADLAVINQYGLIGRVVSTTDREATIQLLTDLSNRVAVRLVDSREIGIVRYLAREGMVLDNFPIQGNISEGDEVLSSGLGGVYPAGLRVGTVTEVLRPKNEPFCRVKVQPAVNVRSLEEVFILRPLIP